MATVFLPVRFGVSPRLRPTEPTLKLYEKVTELLGLPSIQQPPPDLIWISKEFKLARSSTKSLFAREAEKLPPHDTLVIDIGGPNYNECTFPDMFLGLIDFLEEFTKKFSGTQVIVISPEGRHEKDQDYKKIEQVCSGANISFIFLEGPCLGDFWNLEARSNGSLLENLIELYKEARPSIEQRLLDGLIRHVGRFQFNDIDQSYPFYYDFGNCHSDVVDAAFDFLNGHISGSAQQDTKVYYDCSTTEWFKNGVEEALGRLGLVENSQPILTDNIAVNFEKNSILLSPVIRSGSSLKKILETTADLPTIWCLASISKAEKNSSKTRALQIEQKSRTRMIDVNFYLNLKESRNDINDIWKQINAPSLEPENVEIDTKISAAGMWAMILESGFSSETYGPIDREKIENIPNFSNIIENNLSLIGAKLDFTCKSILGDPLPENLIHLCVDEPCARRLSEHMGGTEFEQSIYVSRPLVDEVGDLATDSDADFKSLSSSAQSEIREHRKSLNNIRNITGSAKIDPISVVAFDEFVMSGKTIDSIERLCAFLEVDIYAHVSIASLTGKKIEKNFVVHAFYEFGYTIQPTISVQ